MKKVIVIPARLDSSRLPKKLLLDLNGKTILHRVFDQCSKVRNVKVYVATDSNLIKKEAKSFTNNIIMTKPSHISGTERVVEAVSKIDCDLVVNVQGDEPFINPLLIEDLFNSISNKNFMMSSVMQRISETKDLMDPNCVKVVTNNENDALFFSRSAIPYLRNGFDSISDTNGKIQKKYNFYKHVGVYCYKKLFLSRYSKLKKSKLEEFEKLEQLRVLENDIKIKMIKTKFNSIGIDTIKDYKNALKLYK